MSRRELERFLFRFDKDEALQAAFEADGGTALADYDLDEDERRVLLDGDVVALHRWGVHALLMRNFAGSRGIRYRDEFEKGGLRPAPRPWKR